jgi:hypothetical protein
MGRPDSCATDAGMLWFARLAYDSARTFGDTARRPSEVSPRPRDLLSQNTFHRIDDVSPKGAWTFDLHGVRAQVNLEVSRPMRRS